MPPSPFVVALQENSPRPRIPVLEYRDDWVCIHKPAGISVHPGRQRSAQQSFVTSLLKRQLRRKVFPVHRCAELRFSANIIGEGDNERGDKSKSSDWIELVAPIPPELRSF